LAFEAFKGKQVSIDVDTTHDDEEGDPSFDPENMPKM